MKKMKKTVNFILIFALLCAALCIFASADIAVPEIDPYEAKICNPDGAVAYSYYDDSPTNVLIKYGADVTVHEERGNFLDVYCDGTFFLVKREDVTLAELFTENSEKKPEEKPENEPEPAEDFKPVDASGTHESELGEMLTWVIIALLCVNLALSAIVLANTKKK